MNHRRLHHLINVLKAVDPERYNQLGWTCGSAACAGGWATRDPEFQKLGLSSGRTGAPTYRAWANFEALGRFFDLSSDETYYIFGVSEYRMFGLRLCREENINHGYNTDIILSAIKPQHVIERIIEVLES